VILSHSNSLAPVTWQRDRTTSPAAISVQLAETIARLKLDQLRKDANAAQANQPK